MALCDAPRKIYIGFSGAEGRSAPRFPEQNRAQLPFRGCYVVSSVMLRELRAQIIHETDPEKLLALVDQLQKLLPQKYNLAKANSPNQRPA